MKKLTIISITLLFSAIALGQSKEEPCITCEGNRIDFTKGASAIGTQNESLGINSFSVGYLNKAHGDYSIAMPFLARSYGDRSIALGYNANANGMGSLALGTHSHTGENAVLSVAIGSYVSTSANWAMVLGKGLGDTFLINSKQSSFMVGFNSNLPTLFVGPSAGESTTGKIGIGNVTNPEAKLHIRADETEDATLRLESTGPGKTAGIEFGSGDKSITTANGEGLSFITETDKPFRFDNGDIYLQDISKGIIMRSPDGNCWRGTLNNNGLLQFIQVDCDDLLVSRPGNRNEENTEVRIYPNPTGNSVTVEIPVKQVGARLSIESSAGRELGMKMLNNTSNQINMSSYPAGCYFFYIFMDGNLLEVKKVMKE